jgi:hypothetical protein
MLARSQVTLRAQDGGVADEVTEDHVGSPERLWGMHVSSEIAKHLSNEEPGAGVPDRSHVPAPRDGRLAYS